MVQPSFCVLADPGDRGNKTNYGSRVQHRPRPQLGVSFGMSSSKQEMLHRAGKAATAGVRLVVGDLWAQAQDNHGPRSVYKATPSA
jgi:hypothetical protein